MPKVLRIINRLNLGGPTYNAAYLTKYLEPEFETLLVAGQKLESEGCSKYILDDLGIRPIIIPEMKREINLFDDYKAYIKIKKLIREFEPDVVHTHASKAGFIGRLAAINSNVPVIVHTFHGHVFHSYFGKLKTSFFKFIERYLASKTTKIITLSEKQEQEICDEHKICSKDKSNIVPLGFDLNRFSENVDDKRISFRQQYNIKDDEMAIGIIGRLVPVKNHTLFIDSLIETKKKTAKKLKSFIIGDGEDKESIINYAKMNGLSVSYQEEKNENAELVFTSWITEIDTALAGLDVIAMTSNNEGTPVSLIEAQAAGKPIVTTNVGGVENIVIPNRSAFVCPPHDANCFSDCLVKLTNPELRQSMGASGKNFGVEKFHFSRLTSDIRQLYYNLLNPVENRFNSAMPNPLSRSKI
ncbi:MAG: glycosyltransferase [Bacteroidia bacterium]|nr:glycosyltransferase [Bacteroidia bacterium]